MKIYTYSRNNVSAKIENHNGAWKLNISSKNRVIVLFNDTFPTKRAALKYASIVLNCFNN
jgi:hypothetical protein